MSDMKCRELIKYAKFSKFKLIMGLRNNFTENEINSTDELGNSALFYSLSNCNFKITSYLLSRKANVN